MFQERLKCKHRAYTKVSNPITNKTQKSTPPSNRMDDP